MWPTSNVMWAQVKVMTVCLCVPLWGKFCCGFLDSMEQIFQLEKLRSNFPFLENFHFWHIIQENECTSPENLYSCDVIVIIPILQGFGCMHILNTLHSKWIKLPLMPGRSKFNIVNFLKVSDHTYIQHTWPKVFLPCNFYHVYLQCAMYVHTVQCASWLRQFWLRQLRPTRHVTVNTQNSPSVSIFQ